MDDKKDKTQADTSVDDVNDQMKKFEGKIAELENSWKRALADYKNLERRTAEEKEEFAQFANMILIQRLLPIVDNMQMLEKHIGDTGLKMIIKEFKQILEDSGVASMESYKKDFDTNTMDCIETLECEEKDQGKVLEVVTEGYKYKNKILRPAKVKVGKGGNHGKNSGN